MHSVEIDAPELLIRWVETEATQQRGPNGDLRGYVLTVEEWRQMRAAIRRMTRDNPPGADHA